MNLALRTTCMLALLSALAAHAAPAPAAPDTEGRSLLKLGTSLTERGDTSSAELALRRVLYRADRVAKPRAAVPRVAMIWNPISFRRRARAGRPFLSASLITGTISPLGVSAAKPMW